MGSRLSLLVAVLVTGGLLVAAAAGGPPGQWTPLAQGTGLGASAQEIGLARTPDGVLHVAYRQEAVVRIRSITTAGQVRPEVTAVSGFGLAADPGLVAAGGGLRLFFPAGSPIEGLLSATAPATGSPWSAPALVSNHDLARARTPAVTTAPDGTVLQTWYGGGGGIVVHRGLTPGGEQTILSPAGSTNARPNVAVDASGRVWVVWCRFGSAGPIGTIAQQLDAGTLAPLGGQIQLPGSSTDFQGTANASCVLDATVARHQPLAARAGGGVYAAGTSGYLPRAARPRRLTAVATRPGYVGARAAFRCC